MADFTSLKTAIQNAIRQNGNKEITGNILQEILLSVVNTLGDSAINGLVTALGEEVAARQNADGTLQGNIDSEAAARSQADGTLQQNINNEATARGNADTQLGNRITSEAEARAGADNILRNSINSIIADIEHGYVYAGIATPSTTPATGKVFYLALTAGTYTNFGATVVPQGINILKYNGSTWSVEQVWGVDDTPTDGSNNLVKSGGVKNALDGLQTEMEQVVDIPKTLTSVINLLYNDSTGWDNTPESVSDNVKECRYIETTGQMAYISNITFNKGNIDLPQGRYSLFVKIGLTVNNDDDVRAKVYFRWDGSSSEPAPENETLVYANDAPKSIYLGDLISSGGSKIFYVSRFTNFRTRTGGLSTRNITGKCEYYGAYLIPSEDIEGISKQEVAEALDYSSLSTSFIVDGNFKKLENRVTIIEEQIELLPQLETDVDNLNSNAKKYESESLEKLRYNSPDISTSGIVDDENKLFRSEVTASVGYTTPSVNVNNFSAPPADTYAVFSKCSFSVQDFSNCKAKVGFSAYASAFSPVIVESDIESDNVGGFYVGEITSTGSGSGFFYLVNVRNIRTSEGGFITATKKMTLDFYGTILIPTSELIGIDREKFAKTLNYTSGITYYAKNAIEAIHSINSDFSSESEHSVESDLSNETLRCKTQYENTLAEFYGDSLVTYSTSYLSAPFKYLGIDAGYFGRGGGQVGNYSGKQGFCTIERIALLPKNMKVLCFWGGANDSNYYSDKTQPDWIDNAKFGDIDDQPLGVADMFEHRVTIANMDEPNTLGRTQTFYQAYKTMLRNFSILFPHTLVVCVTQYKSFYYDWRQGKETVILKKNYPRAIALEKDCCAEYSIPICDLYTKAGVNISNCFSMLYDDGGSLIHPTAQLAEKSINLIAQTVSENMYLTEPTAAWDFSLNSDDKDVSELMEYLVDLRSESEINVMTLEEAISGFVDYTTEHSITLKNNMYLVFYANQYGSTKGYFLIDYTNPSSVNSWEEWANEIIYDMRTAINPATEQPFGALTLSQAITAFQAKATLEQWEYSNLMYMYFYTDDNGNWSMYRLTTPSTPSSTSSWTLIKTGQDS